MKRSLAIIVAFCLIWWLLWGGKLISHRETQVANSKIHTTVGYLKTVDLFLQHNWLRYDPGTSSIKKNFVPDSPMDKFFKQSYLERDVSAFNAGNHDLFRIEDNRITSSNPYAHNILLPFNQLRSWRGDLTYRPVATLQANLQSRYLTIALDPPTVDLSRTPNIPAVTLYDISRKMPPARFSGPVVNLFGAVGNDRAFFGKVHLVGDAIVV